MSSLLYLITNLVFRSLCFIVKSVLAAWYHGKKRVVPPIRNPLLLKPGKTLAAEIRQGKLTSEEVVLAYIERVNEVNPMLNAVVEDRFDEALQEARKVDALIQSEVYTEEQLEEKKPLLGIPLTIKLIINVKGCISDGASKLYKGRRATEDAPLVKILKDAGGIILAITNSPEFALTIETNNLLYGKTCNPYDTSRTAGGSSGGESALLGAGASLIGIGNDIGGSIRLPAHFTGIFSHKASFGLIDSSGTFPIIPKGASSDMLYAGPMCRYPEDMVLVTKILMADKGKDIDFNQKVNFEKLKIFYATNIKDPMALPVNKEIVEAIHKALSYFATKYGVTAKKVQIPHVEFTNYVVMHRMQEHVGSMMGVVTSGKMHKMNFLTEIISHVFGEPTFALSTIILAIVEQIPYFVNKNKHSYYRQIENKICHELEILLDENSILLYPTFPVTAPYHYEMPVLLPNDCYMNTFNYSGHPVTCCPAGADSKGMPLGFQIIGKKNNDALTMACALEITKVFGGWEPPNEFFKNM